MTFGSERDFSLPLFLRPSWFQLTTDDTSSAPDATAAAAAAIGRGVDGVADTGGWAREWPMRVRSGNELAWHAKWDEAKIRWRFSFHLKKDLNVFIDFISSKDIGPFLARKIFDSSYVGVTYLEENVSIFYANGPIRFHELVANLTNFNDCHQMPIELQRPEGGGSSS
jgi:hypothetical protein